MSHYVIGESNDSFDRDRHGVSHVSNRLIGKHFTNYSGEIGINKNSEARYKSNCNFGMVDFHEAVTLKDRATPELNIRTMASKHLRCRSACRLSRGLGSPLIN